MRKIISEGNNDRREWFISNFEVPERGNRRTDEQGTLNAEVPEQYFLTTNLRE